MKVQERKIHASAASAMLDPGVGVFLMPNGRLPAFAQRRLDDLLEKKRSAGLTRREEKELVEALDYVDAKTVELLKYAVALKKRRRQATGSRKSGTSSARRRQNGLATSR